MNFCIFTKNGSEIVQKKNKKPHCNFMCMFANLLLIRYYIYTAMLLLISPYIWGQVRLPRLISNGMVLQRDAEVKIWGWASANQKVSVFFNEAWYSTKANEKGDWQVTMNNLQAGGPFEMKIISSDTLTLSDIFIGEVWVCSGQSNMELPMSRVAPIYETEIARSANPCIRWFNVPQQYDFHTEKSELEGGSWIGANPKDVLKFSAVGYFFARELFDRYRVPVGIINTSLGGSPAEAWISEEALKAFPDHYNELCQAKDDQWITKIESDDRERIQNWYSKLQQTDEGYTHHPTWHHPSANLSGWQTTLIPGYLSETSLKGTNGVVWFRKEVNVPASMTGKEAKLILGRIVDADSVFVNGTFIGSTSYQYPPRRYTIPSNLLTQGINTVVVRVISNSGDAGFVPDKAYEITMNGESIDLKGEWQYRLGAAMPPLTSQTFIRWKPAGLYNGMISPLKNYTIKGFTWYQGESNTGRPMEYRKLLTTLIGNWRSTWKNDSLPFLLVQLPNFMKPLDEPGESNWALLRESQLKALQLPVTGMAVAIDLGEWNDIHPLNKKDVGIRLSLLARTIAYKENIQGYTGPIYQSHRVTGKKIEITFNCFGSKLKIRDNQPLRLFSIAGQDKKFVWANAKIKGNKVIVQSKQVKHPLAVRYAWADNPAKANLINGEGLPASPFRSDDW